MLHRFTQSATSIVNNKDEKNTSIWIKVILSKWLKKNPYLQNFEKVRQGSLLINIIQHKM